MEIVFIILVMFIAFLYSLYSRNKFMEYKKNNPDIVVDMADKPFVQITNDKPKKESSIGLLLCWWMML